METFHIISKVREGMSFEARQFWTFPVEIPVGAWLDLGSIEAGSYYEARNKAKEFCGKYGFSIWDIVTDAEFLERYECERSRQQGVYDFKAAPSHVVPIIVVTKKGHDRLVTRHDGDL